MAKKMNDHRQFELFALTDDIAEFDCDFARAFRTLTGFTPFQWQTRLYKAFVNDVLPSALDLPTGLGKTAVIAIWLLARIQNPKLPRRLVYVVDRRAVVDQASAEAEKIKLALKAMPELTKTLGLNADGLPVSTLRGQMLDNRQWLEDPTSPAIIVGTIDMIGSRLLFEGYGVSRGMRPYHAGLLGLDTLVVLDEAHLCPPFHALLIQIAGNSDLRSRDAHVLALLPRFHLLPLSATAREFTPGAFQLTLEDRRDAMVEKRLAASKMLTLIEIETDLVDELVTRAIDLKPLGSRILIYADQRKVVAKVAEALRKRDKTARVEIMTGARRVHERETLVSRLTAMGFLAGSANGETPAETAYLVATSAGEVGVDLDADHLVMDLVSFERMIQRLGRVNRRGEKIARVIVLVTKPGSKDTSRQTLLEQWRAPLEALPDGPDGARDASPAALMALKQQADENPVLRANLTAALTPEPLRPALNRALIDAWSMTSLENHPGRPLVQPWLRGWIDEDEPQVKIAWRAHLPWLEGQEQPNPDDIAAYLEAAPVHLSETLEATTMEICEMLIKRAQSIGRSNEESAIAAETGRAPTLEGRSPAVLFLDASGQLASIRLRRMLRHGLTVGELADLNSQDKRELMTGLAGHQLLAHNRMGGLSHDGLLEAGAHHAPPCVDDGWPEHELRSVLGFRIRPETAATPADEAGWRIVHRFAIATAAADEVQPVCLVEAYRGAGAPRLGDPAVSRAAQELAEHLNWTGMEADSLAQALDLPAVYRNMLVIAAETHDRGKARELWQDAMNAPREWDEAGVRRYYAKTRGGGDPRRLCGYRHEFGSLGDVERDAGLMGLPDDVRDLALHLIASHHGHARPLIPPIDPASPPSLLIDRAREAALRFARLQRRWGPWGLAWWEAILRAADQRASRKLDAQIPSKGIP